MNELIKVLHVFSVFFCSAYVLCLTTWNGEKVPANNNITEFIFPLSKDTIRALFKQFDWCKSGPHFAPVKNDGYLGSSA